MTELKFKEGGDLENGRMYDPVIGRFLGVDPIIADGDNSQSFNSYTYALNNPLRLIDRDGFQYEEAYTGGPFVASISTWSLDTWREMKRLAKKGYEYLDCVGIATGAQDADDVFIQRWLQLQHGPSGQGGYSGDNIFYETWSHYQIGGRKDLNVSTSSLNFSFVSRKDLLFNSKNNTYSVNLFSLNKFSQTSLALGKVSLNSIGNNRYTINRDYYDFNIEWGQGFSTRNIGTFAAGLIHGPVIDNFPLPLPISPFLGPSVYTGSGPYWINFSGSVYIKP